MPPPELPAVLPYVTPELPGSGGRLRVAPDSFVVEEIPLYEPGDEGSHLYLRITKVNLTTKEVQQRIERLLGLPRGSVGYAGLKDKNARTTQTFSLPVAAGPEGDAALVERLRGELPVEIHWARRHRNKLKAGHLLGNRFRIAIHDLPLPPQEALARAEAVAARLRAGGLPNYFGPQRFGGQGDNALLGYEILVGTRRVGDRWLRRFLVSAYQSHLCNRYLALRVERGLFDRLLVGDVAKKHATGGLFDVEDLGAEQPRYEAHEISFTAPLFGYKLRRAQGEAALLEVEVEAETGLTDPEWRRANTEGTRRLGRLLLPDLRVVLEPEPVAAAGAPVLVVEFSLPKGGFATTLLREVMKEPAEPVELPEDEVDS